MSLFSVEFEAARRRAQAEDNANAAGRQAVRKQDPERPAGPAVGAPGREQDAISALAAARVLFRVTRDVQLWKDIIAALCKAGVLVVDREQER
jgi:hypothetical protein